MIIFGTRSSQKAEGHFHTSVCPSCNKKESVVVSVFRYLHVYWIPMFSLGRQRVLVCGHCKHTYKADRDIAREIALSSSKASTPWYHFFGSIVVGALFLVVALTPKQSASDDQATAHNTSAAQQEAPLSCDALEGDAKVVCDIKLSLQDKDMQGAYKKSFAAMKTIQSPKYWGKAYEYCIFLLNDMGRHSEAIDIFENPPEPPLGAYVLRTSQWAVVYGSVIDSASQTGDQQKLDQILAQAKKGFGTDERFASLMSFIQSKYDKASDHVTAH